MADISTVPDFWRYYGNKKLSDVDIILAEEQPAAAAKPEKPRGAATAAGAAADVPASGAVAAAAPTAAGAAVAAVAAGDKKPDNPEAAPAAAAAAARSRRKRQEGEHIFGHSVVLATLSGYCRTKLEDWDDATDATDQQAGSSSGSRAGWQLRREIQLLVPAGQLEAGRLLVRGMYQQQPDLSGVTQAQLIQLLLLADRFEVPKVQAAVSAAFKALPPEQLQWDTVVAVHGLPAGCAELAACQDLFSAVAAKVQHELGDLELALTEPASNKAQQLLELPFGALKQLLQDERTRASSENTVFYAIQRWHEHQQQQIEASNRPQRQRTQQLKSLQLQTQELLQLVRMPHCSQLFIATVVGQSKLATSLFSHHELLLASSYAWPATGQRELSEDAADLPAFKRHPAWLLPARPLSAMTQLTIDWKLPLVQLKEAFERHLETGEAGYVFGDTKVWKGLAVYPCVLSWESSDGSNRWLLGFSCNAELGKEDCRRAVTTFKAKSVKQGVRDVVVSSTYPDLFCRASCSWGCRDFLQLVAVDSWAEAEVALRNHGLVGGDGCLHLSLTVSDVE